MNQKTLIGFLAAGAIALIAAGIGIYSFVKGPVTPSPSPAATPAITGFPLESFIPTPSPTVEQVEDAMRRAVAEALGAPTPEGHQPIPKGTRLLALMLQGATIKIDFSKEIVSRGQAIFDDALAQIAQRMFDATTAIGGNTDLEFDIRIEGKPLAEVLR